MSQDVDVLVTPANSYKKVVSIFSAWRLEFEEFYVHNIEILDKHLRRPRSRASALHSTGGPFCSATKINHQ